MAEFEIKIDGILGGRSSYPSAPGGGQFQDSVGLDPDFPIIDASSDEGGTRPSGVLRPVSYEDFKGANITGDVGGIETTATDNLVYTIQSNGKLVSYSATLGSETLATTFTNGLASFIKYYNNFLYVSGTKTGSVDIDRYGPLNNTPVLDAGFWVTDLSFANLRSGYTVGNSNIYPQNAMHVHTDNKLYICDYRAGRGVIHFIKTTKVTDEGDTNSGSTEEALDLPINFFPADIESFNNDIVIGASTTEDPSTNSGPGALFFWDTVSDSFYRKVSVQDSVITAVHNLNGTIFVWSTGQRGGNGYRVSRYVGGETLEQVAYFSDGFPPNPQSVVAVGNRLMWGSSTSEPITSASVYALGYKQTAVPPFAIQNILTTTPINANTRVVALAAHRNANNRKPDLVVSATNTSGNRTLEKRSTTYGNHLFRSDEFLIGAPFTITEVNIPLGALVAANMTIVPKIFSDRGRTSQALNTINNTKYAGSEGVINVQPNTAATGFNSFFLELKWSGSALLPLELPIIIKGETHAHGTRS